MDSSLTIMRTSTRILFHLLICSTALLAQAFAKELTQVNLTALIQDTKVWSSESLYHDNDTKTLLRQKRSAQSHLVDVCQSKMEVLMPYFATNSKGKLRTIVNSELMQQAIQVETCTRSPHHGAGKCNAQPECGCEQKYKWHRLLALDPRLPSQGLFMDWFLFPSNCVCRCESIARGGAKQFMRLIKKPSGDNEN